MDKRIYFFLFSFYCLQILVVKAQHYRYDKEIGEYDTTYNKIQINPRCIATGKDGNVYLINYKYGNVEVFSKAGKFIRYWKFGYGISFDTQFPVCYSIAVDDSLHVFVLNGEQGIIKYTSNGEMVTSWTIPKPIYFRTNGTKYPYGYDMNLDKFGNVYLTIMKINQVIKYTNNGTQLKQFSIPSMTSYEYDGKPVSIAFDTLCNFYLAEPSNYRVQKFDSTGQLLLSFGSKGTGDGKFQVVTSIAVDSLNYVYVVDSVLKRIQKFDSDGNYLGKFGEAGTENGQFIKPTDISMDGKGNIFITDIIQNSVQYFTSNFIFEYKWKYNESFSRYFYAPAHLAATPLNTLMVTNISKTTTSITFDGKLLSKNILVGGSNPSVDQLPVIAVDKSGQYFVMSNDYRLHKYDVDGTHLFSWGFIYPNTQGSGIGQFNQVGGMSTDSNGNLYIADKNNNRIHKYSSTGAFLKLFDVLGTSRNGSILPVDIKVTENGNLYIADAGDDLVRIYDSLGVLIKSWSIKDTSIHASYGIKALEVNSNGDVFVLDKYGLKLYDNNGSLISLIHDSKFGPANYSKGNSDFTIDADDNVYIIDDYNYKLLKYRPIDAPKIALFYSDNSPLYAHKELNFGVVNPSETSQPIEIKITNISKSSLPLSLLGSPPILVGGKNASDYQVSYGTLPEILEVGDTINLSIVFVPSTTSLRRAKVSIYSNDSLRPVFEIPLVGGSRSSQTISSPTIIIKEYGAAKFVPTISSSSGLPCAFSSSNNTVAKIVKDSIVIVGAGTATMLVYQPGDDSYLSAPNKTIELIVNKVPLKIIAEDVEGNLGESVPNSFPIRFEGFVNSDDASDLGCLPTAHTTANQSSTVGEYPITITSCSITNTNYTVEYVPGIYKVVSTTAVMESDIVSTITIYPNPSVGSFSIKTPFELTSVTLINSIGQTEVHSSKNITTNFKGLVYVDMQTEKGRVIKKIIIQ